MKKNYYTIIGFSFDPFKVRKFRLPKSNARNNIIALAKKYKMAYVNIYRNSDSKFIQRKYFNFR